MSNRTSQLYDFGPYRLDLARRVFTREGRVVPLAPKTFELLHLLVESAGRAFSKQELMAALWPETFVEEANLSFQISVLRKALGEGGAQLIETVPKHGYRFTADVKAVAPAGETPAGICGGGGLPMSAEVRTRRRGATWLAAVGAASADSDCVLRRGVQPNARRDAHGCCGDPRHRSPHTPGWKALRACRRTAVRWRSRGMARRETISTFT